MVIKREIAIPELSGEKKRREYIYLPEDYEKSNIRYPVMYMFDGHNVFFDEDATFGKSWGMNEYMMSSKKQLIIVAVECNSEGHTRLSEYSPVDFEYAPAGKIKGRGKIYMNWLVNTLKPSVDAEFRTLPGRENTQICGSSMGGLMALYASVEFNDVFRKAACLSPSVWIAPDKIADMIINARISGDTIVYMDYGSLEMSRHPECRDALLKVLHALMKKDVNAAFRIVHGGKHSESSWEKQIPVFMECLNL